MGLGTHQTSPGEVPGCRTHSPQRGLACQGPSLVDLVLRQIVVGGDGVALSWWLEWALGTEVREGSTGMPPLTGHCLWKVLLNGSGPQFAAL